MNGSIFVDVLGLPFARSCKVVTGNIAMFWVELL